MLLFDTYMYMCIIMNMNRYSLCVYMYVFVHVHSIITFSSTVQDGCSPLYVASKYGYTEVVDILLKNGADPNLANTVWGVVCSFHPFLVYFMLI